MSVRLAAAFSAAFLTLTGCGAASLNVTRNWEVDAAEAKGVELPAQSKPQTITVEFTSSDCDVGVYVFKKDEIKSDDDLFQASPEKAIASKKGKSESFSVDIPENTGTWVVVRDASKKTKVDLKTTNKK